MTDLVAVNRNAVGTLRVRGAALDPLLTRLRVQHALDAAELRPSSLPPSAILCVRALRDPLPRTIAVAGGGARPSPRWERAATETLDGLARHAARPAQGPVPAGAAAVLFADRAELLAQLARDWGEGMLSVHWWWRGLFPGDTARAVLPAWLETPTQIPAALAHLARLGAARDFVIRLDAAAVEALLLALADGFGLPAVRDVVTARPLPRAAPGAPSSAAEPPWRRWAPEAGSPGLEPPRELLLGVGLVLWRAPAAVRAASFAEAIAVWSGVDRSPRPGTDPDGEEGAVTVEIAAAPHRNRDEPEAGSVSTRRRSMSTPRAGQDESKQQAIVAAAATMAQPAAELSPLLATGDIAPTPAVMDAMDAGVPLVGDVAVTVARDTDFGGLFYLLNLGIALGLYGDFTMPAAPGIPLSPWDFLALLGRRLIGPEIAADPVWPLLAMLAGRGAEEEPGAGFTPPADWRLPPAWLDPFAETACWTWHADRNRLQITHPAGFPVLDIARPPSLPRALRRETAAYGSVCLQEEAKAPLPSQRLTGGGIGEAGDYSVQETSPSEANAPGLWPCGVFARHVRTPATPNFGRFPRGSGPTGPKLPVFPEIRHLWHPPPHQKKGPKSRGWGEGSSERGSGLRALARWLDCLAPYVRARLTRALGVDDDALPGLLLRHHAQVFVTAVNVDVVLSLVELPIAIRLCGLDRDPGWIPAANRVVTFRFV